VGRTLELRFTPPVLATDGQRLSKPMEIEIFRTISPPGAKPAAISSDQPWLTLAPSQWLALLKSPPPNPPQPGMGGNRPAEAGPKMSSRRTESGENTSSSDRRERGSGALVPGALKPGGGTGKKTRSGGCVPEGSKIVERYTLSDQEFDRLQGSTFSFAARGLTRGFRRHSMEGTLSNVATVMLLDVSPPVEGVLAQQPMERAIELRWLQPVRTLRGRPISGLLQYHVYKNTTGAPDSFLLWGETASARFEDTRFRFGETYLYRVRAVFKEGDHVAESEDSLPAKIAPIDTFPPAAPSGLTGLYSAGAVELIWNTRTETDLAGYNVYRRENSGPPHRINAELLSTPIFRDTSVEPGHSYSYWVTALDLARNESPSSPSVEVDTR
jgi:hypothetical protein